VLILLPPSETKREGGELGELDVSRLRFLSLTETRLRLVQELQRLAHDREASIKALKISARQHSEVVRNRNLSTSPTMPAIDRYTGVVFDALDAASLPAASRRFAAKHLVIQSALLGPVGALDPIPAYRLSHDSKLPGIHLAKTWAPLASAELVAQNGLVLDMRSEAYVALAPVAGASNSWFVRVVSKSENGEVRTLNHFNKKSKGLLTRALLLHAQELHTIDEVIAVARSAGFTLDRGAPGEIRMFVPA
jgi:cytoplasmic iron level regulating protein YaaA (DUF328/UPF0246 family)